jgi:glycerol-3-phosphate acyltransferase PlsX
LSFELLTQNSKLKIYVMRIAIDAMGGDRAPEEVVKGALAAARDFGVGVTLVGDENEIRRYLPAQLPDGVEVRHASQVLEMGEAPTQVRRKKDSSIAVATRLHKEGHAQAVLSAGNTGAAAAAALFILERIPGVDRPGIATIFPTARQPLVLLDAGANVDCRPQHLAQFALMGAAYSRCILQIISSTAGDFFGVSQRNFKQTARDKPIPSVGLLSIGEEETKGNDLTKAAFKLLQTGAAGGEYSFYGNVEGRDIGAGTVEVVVCDGFVGNVVLKVAEGLAKMFGAEMRRALTSDWRAKIGALILKPALGRFKKRLDYTEFGGAALLGVNGICIICHGSSDHRSIYSAIRITLEIEKAGVTEAMRAAIESGNAIQNQAVRDEAVEESAGAKLAAAELSKTELSKTESGQSVVPPINF